MAHPHLSKAPIVEAVLDIRVGSAGQFSTDLVRAFHTKVASDFPIYERAFHIESEIKFGPNASAPAIKQIEYARLRSADKTFICIVRPNGLSLSRLTPYTEWKDLRERAKALWALYLAEFQPTVVTRLGLRYINRIELDSNTKIEDTFRTHLQVSSSLPQTLSGFRLNFTLPSADQKHAAVINQVFDLAQSQKSGKPTIVFDIDAFRNVRLSRDSNEVWEGFESLHDFKNDVFFESLTKSAQERFA